MQILAGAGYENVEQLKTALDGNVLKEALQGFAFWGLDLGHK